MYSVEAAFVPTTLLASQMKMGVLANMTVLVLPVNSRVQAKNAQVKREGISLLHVPYNIRAFLNKNVKLSVYYMPELPQPVAGITPAYAGITPADGAQLILVQ